MDSFTVRLVLRLTYLAVVLVGGGVFYASVYAFEGTLVLVKDRPERTVAAAAGTGGLAHMLQPAMPAELLSADNPSALARALDPNEVYTTAQLPRAIKLVSAEVLETRPERLVVEVRRRQEAHDYPAEAGAVIPWGEAEARVREVRPWLGLLHTPSGSPTAALSLRRGEESWTRGIFLAEGAWREVEGETGLLLRWWNTAEEAKARFPETLGPLFGARWGVADGERMHWFTALAPGTGAFLSDDTEVTLMAVEADREGMPAILVSLKPKSGPESQTWHRADAAEGPVLLDLPGRFKKHVLLNAWRDGAANVAVYANGARGEIRLLKAGEALDVVDGPGFALRLDAAMRTGTPSTAIQERQVLEAVLDTPGGELALREGAMHAREDNAQVRFRRMAQPPRARYEITVGREPPVQLVLGDSVQVGNWKLSYAREVVQPGQFVVLDAHRSVWTPGSLLGGTLLFAGCYGFVIARALIGRKSSYSSSSSDLSGVSEASNETGDTDKADN